MKFIVHIPGNFIEERTYVAKVIFNEFLGADVRVEVTPDMRDEYVLLFQDCRIRFEDHFFSHIRESDDYLSRSLIPQNVLSVKERFTAGATIVQLFGRPGIDIQQKQIICRQDIFASVFFMLTRWEEMVATEYDFLDRFPAEASVAFKCNFLARPVVNEWVDMLKNMIVNLQPGWQFVNPQPFRLFFTHDIDFLNRPVTIREFAKDVLRRRSFKAFQTRLGYAVKNKNPYDLIEYFMEVSEQNDAVSRFYFMTGHNVPGKDGENYNGTSLYLKSLQKIIRRGHVVGFHPSLLTYNDPVMFEAEKKKLEEDLGAQVNEGRQHALRFRMPDTWCMWEEAGMLLDSTLGYSKYEGFRCGTGNTFTVFDCRKRRSLTLKERPLVVMDTTLQVNRKLTIEESSGIITHYINTGRKFDMPVTLLFHNLIDDAIDWKGWKSLYDNLFLRGRNNGQ